MNDFLIKQYTNIRDTVPFLRKVKYYTASRFFIRLCANIILPLWFRISGLFMKKNIREVRGNNKKVIVSLTTFPARIDRIWIVIECMLRQSIKPDKLILWLSKDQFSSEDVLPKKLLSLKKRGLEIAMCEGDLRSHKKYFYSLQHYPNDYIVTIDDDLLYPSFLIKELLDLNSRFPGTIACHRGLKIKADENNVIRYNKLEYIYGGEGPARDIFFTTGGGTLFTKQSFIPEVINKDVFMQYCKYADDVWLNLMAQFNKTEVVKSDNHFEPIPLFNFHNITLSSVNVDGGLNDKQLSDVRAYYSNTFSLGAFDKIKHI